MTKLHELGWRYRIESDEGIKMTYEEYKNGERNCSKEK